MEYFEKNHGELVKRQRVYIEHGKYLEQPTFDNMGILQLLYLSDEGVVPLKLLRKLLKMNGSQLTRAAQSLIKAGFIYYELDDKDHRLKLIRLTALGVSLRQIYLDAIIPTANTFTDSNL